MFERFIALVIMTSLTIAYAYIMRNKTAIKLTLSLAAALLWAITLVFTIFFVFGG